MKRCVPLVVVGCCAVLGLGLFTLSGCVTPTATGASLVAPGRPLKADVQTQPSEQLTGAIDDFGLALLKATETSAGANVIVSPASVHAALSMTANGATDETEKQMRLVLRTGSMSPADTNTQWASLLAQLAERSSDQTLTVANSLWARKGIAFKKPFVDGDRDFFGAGVSVLDFQKDDVAGAVNGWVSKNTHGMITQIVDKVPANAILYLANAVYFKGDWVSPFEHQRTQKSPFTRADGAKIQVDMMNATERLPYAESTTLQATRLPYKGGDSAYYVLLPKQGVSLDAAMSSLRGTGFSELRRTMTSQDTTEVILGLPKLDAEFSTDLAKPLAAMGMPRAFDQNLAQFSDMATLDVPIYINRVLHRTKIKVDEKGTEAAAATVVEMTAGAMAARNEPPSIVCDRPYLFSIVDEKSGAMLFLGAVNDPTLK